MMKGLQPMKGHVITRRRAISITAAAAGIAVMPGTSSAETIPYRWRGWALGTETEIVLLHGAGPHFRRQAELLIGRCRDEIDRLENEFSLYREASALCRLNRDGRLPKPSQDMLRLLSRAREISRRTGGAFDVTVQPLWALYTDHFSGPGSDHGADPMGPPEAALGQALGRVDYRLLDFDTKAATFTRPGMAATFNGIAQGYITDRVSELLKAAGADRVLVNIGEIRGLGNRGGSPWRVAIPFGRGTRILDVRDAAIATSSGSGTVFDSRGRHHHLFDPRSGASANHYSSVSVSSRNAATADALSTASYILPPAGIQAALSDDETAYITFADGKTKIITGSGGNG